MLFYALSDNYIFYISESVWIGTSCSAPVLSKRNQYTLFRPPFPIQMTAKYNPNHHLWYGDCPSHEDIIAGLGFDRVQPLGQHKHSVQRREYPLDTHDKTLMALLISKLIPRLNCLISCFMCSAWDRWSEHISFRYASRIASDFLC